MIESDNSQSLPIRSKLGRTSEERKAIREIVAKHSRGISFEITDAIVSILCDPPQVSIERLWSKEISSRMHRFHRMTQLKHPNSLRLEFSDVRNSLAETWLEYQVIPYEFLSATSFFSWLNVAWRNRAASLGGMMLAVSTRERGNHSVRIETLVEDIEAPTAEEWLVDFLEIARAANWTNLEDLVLAEFALAGKNRRQIGEELGFTSQWIGKVLESAIGKGRAAYESIRWSE